MQNLYLEGRLGGIPNILFDNTEIKPFVFSKNA